MVVKKQLLAKMNDTIDELIENRRLMKQIMSDPRCAIELTALEKTQESLLARLAHLHNYMQEKKLSRSKASFSLQNGAHRSRVRRCSKRGQVAIV